MLKIHICIHTQTTFIETHMLNITYITSQHLSAGSMNNLALWDKALSPGAISLVYRDQNTSSVFCCPESCPSGQTSTDRCTGSLAKDCGPTLTCPVCLENQRMSAECSGDGSSSSVTCLACKSSCLSGVRDYCISIYQRVCIYTYSIYIYIYIYTHTHNHTHTQPHTHTHVQIYTSSLTNMK